MIKKNTLYKIGFAVLLPICAPFASFAGPNNLSNSDFYINAHLAPGFLDINQNIKKPETKDAQYSFAPVGGGIGLAYKTREKIKLEVEGIIAAKNEIKFDNRGSTDYKGQMTYAGLMANAYYNVYSSDIASGYVGAGAGLAYLGFNDLKRENNTNTEFATDSTMAFAIQAKAGFSMKNFSSKFIPYAGYRFLHLGESDTSIKISGVSQTESVSFNIHSIQIGGLIPFNAM